MAMSIGEAAFRALAESREEAIFLTDRDGRYLAVNRGFCRLIGRPQSEILGRTAFDLLPHGIAERDALDDRRVLDGERVEREEQRPRGYGSQCVRTVRIPVRDEAGRVQAVLGVAREAAADEAALEASRMELVGRLAGGVAHDANNLLTAALGYLTLLRDHLPPDGPQQELMDGAEKAAVQAAELAGQLLAFLRREPPRPEPVDLNGVVGRIIGLLRRTFDPRIRIDVRLQPGLPRAPAVSSQIAQLLLNLCLNARDAMPRGGVLLVETSAAAAPSGAVRAPSQRPGFFVRLRVADTGEGIAPAVQAQMFDPAFTTKGPGQGTGLGLAIVQSVVRQHRGWVDCVSDVGRGACFDVYLPAVQQDEAIRNGQSPG